GRLGDCPVHLTHFRQPRQGIGSYHDYLGLVEDARATGMDVTFDCYSYPFSGTTLVILLPLWARSGGPEGLLGRLRDPAERARMARDMAGGPWGEDPWAENWLTNFQRPENKQ